METEKLYYQDPFMGEFTATVLACEAAKNGYQVVLDRTAFYPEGGGQPTDHGTLGSSNVTDVHEKDGVIFHTCDKAVEIGQTVTGCIDWARRFDHMQQHSGEHIISGILCRDYRCDNVGFHMGADTVTIDYNADISWEQALDAQRKANEVIWADQATEIAYPSPQELATLDYRSKKELTGKVRIVTFPEADCCACCGTHVRRSGEVGLVKVLSVQKFREGVRIELVCGGRALRYVNNVMDQNHQVSNLLSAKVFETGAAVQRLLEENNALKSRILTMEDQRFAALAQQYAGAGDVLLFEEGLTPDGVRRLADAVMQGRSGRAAVFAGTDAGGYAYAIGQVSGDLRGLTRELNACLNGRGGGKPGFVQGNVRAKRAEIEAFWREKA